MSLGEVATLVTLRRGNLRLVEERIAEGSSVQGRAVEDLDLPASCTLLAVLRGDDVLPSTSALVLHEGDEVLAVVHAGAAEQLARTFGRPDPNR